MIYVDDLHLCLPDMGFSLDFETIKYALYKAKIYY